jgi:hypothetical protein
LFRVSCLRLFQLFAEPTVLMLEVAQEPVRHGSAVPGIEVV